LVHVASVWVPFTSESKEAIASYPEILKEIRLALQAVGRKLGMYLRRRQRVAQEGQRRSIFRGYLGEVASAVSVINGTDRARLYEDLLAVAKRKTAEADVKLDDRGRPVAEEEDLDFGDNCIIVAQGEVGLTPAAADAVDDEISAGRATPRQEGKLPAKGRGKTRRHSAAGDDPVAADSRPSRPDPRAAAETRGKAKRPSR